ncbi:hypothetical protein [Nostoc sp.]|uniref:hypothetical protein n=1 Tax=Nostoc sp. TaxID=1180 RepID=UPI002FF5297C
MSDNPRQFSSIDSSDANLHGSLTNRPASGAPAGDPIDFEALNRQVINQRTQQDYVYKESTAESVLRREREIAASLKVRQETADAKAAQELQFQSEQVQRNELRNRISNNSPSDPEVASPRPESPLAQIQRSTLERQSPPSTGSPPPTPSGTATRASALVEPTATPAPAALREAIPPTAGAAFGLLPRSLPAVAGRFVVPGVVAGIDFTSRVVHGQSVVQAAVGTGGSLVGAGIGTIAGTAIAGPLGGVVGGIIGGYIGGAIGDYFWSSFHPPTAARQENYTPNYPPFQGGQEAVEYHWNCSTDANPRSGDQLVFGATGPISDFRVDGLINTDTINGIKYGNWAVSFNQGYGPRVTGSAVGFFPDDLPRLVVKRVDNQPDPKNIPSPAPPPDNAPYRFDSSPVGNDSTVPSGLPAAGANKGKSTYVAPSMPSNNRPNGANGFPGHGGLAPSFLPNPTQAPSNLGGLLPAQTVKKPPLPFAEPDDIPAPRPSGNGQIQVDTSNGAIRLYSPLGATPTSVPENAKAVPIGDGVSPVPKALTQPVSKTATDKTNETVQQQKKDFDEQIKRLTAIATAIAALTPAIQGIPNAIANSPNVKAATQGAVCEIAQPGGCLGDAIDNSANKVNQNNNQNTANILDKINAGANAAQLALLELINTKLGDLLPGGLSATFTRLWQTLQVDRILNILILVTTFHNALMLSNNLAQTLFAAIDNISQAVGFKWKNEKGEESGFGSIVSEWTASFFKAIFGEENYTELVATYKKANRIYQATANIFNALQSIGYSILSALEVVGSYVALIGNALRKWGEVGESAYKWFNPQPNFHNKFFTTLEGVTNVVSQVDQVASEVVSVEQNVAQIGELKNELGKSIGEEDGSKQGVQPPEATKVKAGFDADKLVSATGIAISDSDKEADE